MTYVTLKVSYFDTEYTVWYCICKSVTMHSHGQMVLVVVSVSYIQLNQVQLFIKMVVTNISVLV